MSLTITNRTHPKAAILELNGRLMLGEATATLRDATRKALEQGSDILIDLSGVSYIDSAGLGELVSAYSSAVARDRKVKLLRPMERVNSLLHITKMYSTFEIFEDEAQAIASFQ